MTFCRRIIKKAFRPICCRPNGGGKKCFGKRCLGRASDDDKLFFGKMLPRLKDVAPAREGERKKKFLAKKSFSVTNKFGTGAVKNDREQGKG
jgi:hypothetical protein